MNVSQEFSHLIHLTAGHCDLTVWVRPDTDLDSRFEAICDISGERLSINGWMFVVVDSDEGLDDYRNGEEAFALDYEMSLIRD